MKKMIIGIAIIAIAVTACNNSNNTSSTIKKNDSLNSSTPSTETTASNNSNANSVVIAELVNQYLQIKNALANDNGSGAASGGKAFVDAMDKINTTAFTPEKKKTWDDISDDAKEMAEHIGANADKLEHQREHFEMLSQDVYDLIKTFGAGQTLYKDFCPMYNNKKGASWLSETKEIKNPYLGKEMPDCGTVKEEIKQ